MRPFFLPTLAPHATKHGAIAILSAVITSAASHKGSGRALRTKRSAGSSLYSLACANMSKIDAIGLSDYFTISQLSPTVRSQIVKLSNDHVENNGFEPLTPCLQSRCSSQLS